ncbi:hypothetical protein B0J12DRAFT_692087 [Macrophomina phaseolina]|uniref:FAD-binding domain-containing protein n=1 Tax=Macrophomina phaseolina TaxID=35725 RepID=A0ABQ8FPP0_9PEZI|nr:hypothetical protein B0J12DRAFT_692087 [Macrophomina phaseolina]
MPLQGFRVIIVGGSVAGLALALMLEKKRHRLRCARSVGASIGVLPNGLRILDQLGCYEIILKTAQYPVNTYYLRDSDGKPLVHLQDVEAHARQRHGYPMLFFQRQMLIKILYDHIQDKSKVLTSQRVTSIDENDQGVSVRTKDGSLFEGDIVVGADGVRSAVRREMWHAMSESGLVRNQVRDTDIKTKYGCIFGISTGITEIPKGLLQINAGQCSSVLVASGPGHDTYWALFYDLGKTYYGADNPRFGKKDEEDVVVRHWNDAITEKIRFSDLYDRKTTSVCTPLHEYVVRAWHSQRSIVIGDAAHKFNPITGQGGNSALETAAALTNELVKTLNSHGPDVHVSGKALHFTFQAVQQLRSPRASQLVHASTSFQRLTAMETLLHRGMIRNVVPRLGNDLMLHILFRACTGAVSLDMLDVPSRPRGIPYDDEVMRRPGARSASLMASCFAAFLGLSCLGVYLLHKVSTINGTWWLAREAVEAGFVPEVGVPLQSIPLMAALPTIERLFRSLTAIFFGVVSGATDYTHRIQARYFLLAFYPPLLTVMMIEGYRKRNTRSLLQSPSLWAGAAQLFGLGIVLPLYLTSFLLHSRHESYWNPSSRSVPIAASKAILPALVFGYLIPSIFMLALSSYAASIQPAIAFWQITPIFAIILVDVFRYGPSIFRRTEAENALSASGNRDLPFLTLAYRGVFAISALAHIATVIFLAFSSSHSFSGTFIPRDPLSPVSTIADGMFLFLQFDLLLCIAATLLWSIITVYDLHRGGVPKKTALKSVGIMAIGYVVVGPGAMTAALWQWREEAVAQIKPKHEKIL